MLLSKGCITNSAKNIIVLISTTHPHLQIKLKKHCIFYSLLGKNIESRTYMFLAQLIQSIAVRICIHISALKS